MSDVTRAELLAKVAKLEKKAAKKRNKGTEEVSESPAKKSKSGKSKAQAMDITMSRTFQGRPITSRFILIPLEKGMTKEKVVGEFEKFGINMRGRAPFVGNRFNGLFSRNEELRKINYPMKFWACRA